jgi:hypothetical protein
MHVITCFAEQVSNIFIHVVHSVSSPAVIR